MGRAGWVVHCRTWCLHMVIALKPGRRLLEGHRPEARALEVLLGCR